MQSKTVQLKIDDERYVCEFKCLYHKSLTKRPLYELFGLVGNVSR